MKNNVGTGPVVVFTLPGVTWPSKEGTLVNSLTVEKINEYLVLH